MPPQLGHLPSMNTIAYDGSYTINLENNELTGSIPPEMGELAGINYIRLENNQLSGPIPADIGGLTKLQRLDLENNQLSGPIPAELGDLKDKPHWWGKQVLLDDAGKTTN